MLRLVGIAIVIISVLYLIYYLFVFTIIIYAVFYVAIPIATAIIAFLIWKIIWGKSQGSGARVAGYFIAICTIGFIVLYLVNVDVGPIIYDNVDGIPIEMKMTEDEIKNVLKNVGYSIKDKDIDSNIYYIKMYHEKNALYKIQYRNSDNKPEIITIIPKWGFWDLQGKPLLGNLIEKWGGYSENLPEEGMVSKYIWKIGKHKLFVTAKKITDGYMVTEINMMIKESTDIADFMRYYAMGVGALLLFLIVLGRSLS